MGDKWLMGVVASPLVFGVTLPMAVFVPTDVRFKIIGAVAAGAFFVWASCHKRMDGIMSYIEHRPNPREPWDGDR